MNEYTKRTRKSRVDSVVFIVVISIILLAILLSVRTVSAGTVKVVTRFGRVTGRVLSPGLHLVVPFADGTRTYDTKKVIYETTTEEKQKGSDADYKDFPVDTNTSDGQQVDIFYTVRFSVDPTLASWVAQNIGSQEALVEKIVKTESRIWVRNVPREFTADSLYTGSGVIDVQNGIADQLRGTFEANGLILDSFGIREIKFTDEYITAIENKQLEAVKVNTAENIAARAVFEKEARITRAEGQAQEQELQRTTLTDALLQKMWIEKWKGNVPDVVTGGSSLIFQLPD
jgi:regulator of protease activity HflC (stomatin/prohibitin superfamily)